MKCPKCSYLGFETGDRCKNCGYDFSLLAAPAPVAPDLNIRAPEPNQSVPDVWLDRMDSRAVDVSIHAIDSVAAPAATAVVTSPPASEPRELSFPLFSPASDVDDEPLIKLPAAPRPPLAVRRTPDIPRLRPPSKPAAEEGNRLELEFSEAPASIAPARPPVIQPSRAPGEGAVSGLGRRGFAALIDHGILLAIDFIVVYSTLRMSALTINEWALLPPVPIVAFLVMLKLSYFGAFTAACGQTIGKMAMRIRVVADDARLDPARAARRTLVSAVSLLAAGTGFIPVFIDPDHRALHDRMAGTRVVEVTAA
jgi:uncharacterized RDD family membrane protein YckC